MVRYGHQIMSKILHKGSWYSPVDSWTIYEKVYENRIETHAGELFPGFYCLPFKKAVDSIYGRGRPDLVLIDRQYRSWIIVEVELEHHPLRNDVEDQVRKFASGKYGDKHAEYIYNKNNEIGKYSDLDFEKLKLLVRGTQPKISVIVPVEKPSWWKSLLQYNATIAVIEIWEDDTGRYFLRVNGDQPAKAKTEFLSKVFRDPITPSGLRLENPAVLDSSLNRVSIFIGKYLTIWRIMRSKSGAWLIPDDRTPIDEMSALSFKLIISDSGDLQLEEDYGEN